MCVDRSQMTLIASLPRDQSLPCMNKMSRPNALTSKKGRACATGTWNPLLKRMYGSTCPTCDTPLHPINLAMIVTALCFLYHLRSLTRVLMTEFKHFICDEFEALSAYGLTAMPESCFFTISNKTQCTKSPSMLIAQNCSQCAIEHAK